jgi:hypothetical protein
MITAPAGAHTTLRIDSTGSASSPPLDIAAAQNATSNAAPNFDRVARIYRWLEYLTFGPLLWRCRIHFLPQLGHCRRALILGDGDGRFTARLLCGNPDLEATAIDCSPRMIASLQRASAAHASRLKTQVADLRDWQWAAAANMSGNMSANYDLIVTHFFLDCLTTEEVAALSARLAHAASPGALWLVSEFAIPSSFFGHYLAAPLVAALYRAFRLLTGLAPQSLPDHPQALAASGWSLHSQRTHFAGLLLSQLWRLPDRESRPPFRSST